MPAMQALRTTKRSSPLLVPAKKSGDRTLGPAPGASTDISQPKRHGNERDMKGFAIRALTAYSTVLLATTAPFLDASALVCD
jgi:hypothetical protein